MKAKIHISHEMSKNFKLCDFRKPLDPTVAARWRRRPVQCDDNIENGRMIATIQASKPGNDYYSIWVPMRTARGHLQSSARWICSMFCSGNPHCWFSRISQSMNKYSVYCVQLCFKYQVVCIMVRFCKGQLISKCLFGIFNSPKKRTQQFDYYGTSSRIVSVRFLEN